MFRPTSQLAHQMRQILLPNLVTIPFGLVRLPFNSIAIVFVRTALIATREATLFDRRTSSHASKAELNDRYHEPRFKIKQAKKLQTHVNFAINTFLGLEMDRHRTTYVANTVT